MKICFIWVEKFRNFENFGFNLSSSQKFKYDSKNNILSRIKIDPLPVNFFGERIEDVVGIIGKNGAGKSNAIELICKILKGAKTSLQTNFLIIVEEDGNLFCYYSGYFMDSPKADFAIGTIQYNGNINPLKIVFFSNVFDERKNEFDREVADISLNKTISRSPFLRRNKSSNFESQIDFINTRIFPTLNIEVPSKIQLTSKVWMTRFSDSNDRLLYGDDNDKIRNFKKDFRERLRDIIPENKFIHLLRFGFFFETYDNYSKRMGINRLISHQLFGTLVEFIANVEKLRTTEEITAALIDYLDDEFAKISHDTVSPEIFKMEGKGGYYMIEKINRQIRFLKNIKSSIPNLELKYNSEGMRNRGVEYFTLPFIPNSTNDFIYELISLFSESNIFDINWIGISSGHKAYLNLYASIHKQLRLVRSSNLLLCIDEGDLYLHPIWQIEFFDKLISILPKLFSGNIQLVLTSHSPFLLSDLPKQNITILDISTNNCSIDGIDLPNNTFGGNLYELFSKPFFLGNKRISDFAYNKISELINSIGNKQLSVEEKKERSEIADLIGDEIIRFRIKQMLENDNDTRTFK